jgi:hypothetical protein
MVQAGGCVPLILDRSGRSEYVVGKMEIRTMNDAQIRSSLHRKKLRRQHTDTDTLVIDELGLRHGACRADVAVVNGHLIGYEIKSDEDSLGRLAAQIDAYGAVFDRATAVVGERHLCGAKGMLPRWWGITVATEGQRGAVHFATLRRATPNPSVDLFAVAQLLWKDEVQEELSKLGLEGKVLRQRRELLYGLLVKALRPHELRRVVRERLKNRTGWRCPAQPSSNGG